jgi:hypothetical protein
MLRTTRLRTASVLSLALGLSGLAPTLRAAEPALDRLVPADAALVFAIEDLPALRTRFSASPFGRVFADPAVEKFLAPLFSNSDYLEFIELVKTETGYTPEQLLDFAAGDIQLSVPLSSLKTTQPKFNADFLLAMELGENDAKLRELIEQQQSKQKDASSVTETTEDHNGATLHIVAPAAPKSDPDDLDADSLEAASAKKTFVWTIHQGRLFSGSSRELVTGALDAVAAGGLAESLSSAPRYRAVLERAGGRPDYVFFADIESVYPAVVAAIDTSRDPSEHSNAMGTDPANILKAFGLDTLGVFSATGSVAADGATTSDVVLTHGEPRGLVKLLAYRDGPVPRPDWIPAGWINVSSQNFSIPDLYAELEQILDRISPMVAGMAAGQIKAFDRELKIDIKRDLIGNFGPGLVSGLALPGGASAANPPSYDEMENFFAVSLADAAAFERAIDAIKGRFLPPEGGPLEKREYLGRSLYVFTPPQGASAAAKGMAYAIADGWLLVSVGSAGPVEAVLQRMDKPDDSTSFWARSEVRAALESVPLAAFSLQFDDLPPMLSALCAFAVKAQAARDDEETPLVDASAVPTAEVFAKYLSHVVTHGERKADGIYLKSHTPAAPAR